MVESLPQSSKAKILRGLLFVCLFELVSVKNLPEATKHSPLAISSFAYGSVFETR